MATFAERIKELADRADQLEGEIDDLADEAEEIEGYEDVLYLADVPGYLRMAQGQAHNAYMALDSAGSSARRGGA